LHHRYFLLTRINKNIKKIQKHQSKTKNIYLKKNKTKHKKPKQKNQKHKKALKHKNIKSKTNKHNSQKQKEKTHAFGHDDRTSSLQVTFSVSLQFCLSVLFLLILSVEMSSEYICIPQSPKQRSSFPITNELQSSKT